MLDRDQEISDEVYRAMSGLVVCKGCEEEFHPGDLVDSGLDHYCNKCFPGIGTAAQAIQAFVHASKVAAVSAAESAKAFNRMSKAMYKININKRD